MGRVSLFYSAAKLQVTDDTLSSMFALHKSGGGPLTDSFQIACTVLRDKPGLLNYTRASVVRMPLPLVCPPGQFDDGSVTPGADGAEGGGAYVVWERETCYLQ